MVAGAGTPGPRGGPRGPGGQRGGAPSKPSKADAPPKAPDSLDLEMLRRRDLKQEERVWWEGDLRKLGDGRGDYFEKLHVERLQAEGEEILGTQVHIQVWNDDIGDWVDTKADVLSITREGRLKVTEVKSTEAQVGVIDDDGKLVGIEFMTSKTDNQIASHHLIDSPGARVRLKSQSHARTNQEIADALDLERDARGDWAVMPTDYSQAVYTPGNPTSPMYMPRGQGNTSTFVLSKSGKRRPFPVVGNRVVMPLE